MGSDKTKYNVRANLSWGHIRAILRACIHTYDELDGDYSFVFSAANDVGKNEHENTRF